MGLPGDFRSSEWSAYDRNKAQHCMAVAFTKQALQTRSLTIYAWGPCRRETLDPGRDYWRPWLRALRCQVVRGSGLRIDWRAVDWVALNRERSLRFLAIVKQARGSSTTIYAWESAVDAYLNGRGKVPARIRREHRRRGVKWHDIARAVRKIDRPKN